MSFVRLFRRLNDVRLNNPFVRRIRGQFFKHISYETSSSLQRTSNISEHAVSCYGCVILISFYVPVEGFFKKITTYKSLPVYVRAWFISKRALLPFCLRMQTEYVFFHVEIINECSFENFHTQKCICQMHFAFVGSFIYSENEM